MSILSLVGQFIIKVGPPLIQSIQNKYTTSSNSKVSGCWICQYKFPKLDIQKNKTITTIETQIVLLKEKNKIVTGKTIYAKEHHEKFYGELSEKYLTGKYYNTSIGQNYHGAFQFIISNNSLKMEGRWVGFNRSGSKIKTNTWRWLKLPSEAICDKNQQMNDINNIIIKNNLYKNKRFI